MEFELITGQTGGVKCRCDCGRRPILAQIDGDERIVFKSQGIALECYAAYVFARCPACGKEWSIDVHERNATDFLLRHRPVR